MNKVLLKEIKVNKLLDESVTKEVQPFIFEYIIDPINVVYYIKIYITSTFTKDELYDKYTGFLIELNRLNQSYVDLIELSKKYDSDLDLDIYLKNLFLNTIHSPGKFETFNLIRNNKQLNQRTIIQNNTMKQLKELNDKV